MRNNSLHLMHSMQHAIKHLATSVEAWICVRGNLAIATDDLIALCVGLYQTACLALGSLCKKELNGSRTRCAVRGGDSSGAKM